MGEDLELAATRTRRMMLLEPDPGRPAQVAIAYTNGAPALVTRSFGRGRVALLTTTIDRDWGDLPLRPGFVPLIQRTATWLAGVQGGQASRQIFVGEPYALPGPGPYQIRLPSGDIRTVRGENESAQARFTHSDAPGHYEVRVPSSTHDDMPVPGHFVVAVDPRESDTMSQPLPERSSDDGTRESAGAQARVAIHEARWREFIWIAVVLLGLESALRLWQRRS